MILKPSLASRRATALRGALSGAPRLSRYTRLVRLGASTSTVRAETLTSSKTGYRHTAARLRP